MKKKMLLGVTIMAVVMLGIGASFALSSGQKKPHDLSKIALVVNAEQVQDWAFHTNSGKITVSMYDEISSGTFQLFNEKTGQLLQSIDLNPGSHTKSFTGLDKQQSYYIVSHIQENSQMPDFSALVKISAD